jgi:hypothetical protein
MAQRAPLATNLTVDEFLVFPTPDGKTELVRGELRMTPSPAPRHGIVCANLTTFLNQHVRTPV